MKKLIAFIVAISCAHSLCATEDRATLCYLKAGGTYLINKGEHIVLPTVGLSARFQRDSFGVDLSANLASLLMINEVKGQVVGLWYPVPRGTYRFYCGAGSGIGYVFDLFHSRSFLTLEGLIGLECHPARFCKTFLQLELTQPVYRLSGIGRTVPTAALSIGFGF